MYNKKGSSSEASIQLETRDVVVEDIEIDEDTTTKVALTSIPFKKAISLFFTKENPPKEPKRAFFWWYPPEQSKAERLLVFKLDVSIMTYVCLSYFTRYLDATNVASAYVSGMKEDLNISGEEYVWLTQLFQSAYCLAGFISTMILTKVRFSRMLPLLEITWGLLCLFIYKAQSFKTIAVLRFFQGLCEGTAWPAIHYILGSWYTPKEIGKRTSIFISSGVVGVLLSGVIQAALKKTMDGKNGLDGWRWLFIIDAIITFPIAFLGLLVPDSPENTKPRFYLSAEELALARERVKVDNKERINVLNFGTIKRVLTSYQWYLFVGCWTFWQCGQVLQSYFSIVLKALGYDVYDRNNIPASMSGFGIVCCLVSGFIIDLTGKRIYCALFFQLLWIIGVAILKSWNIPNSGVLIGYILQGSITAISPIVVGWCNELCREDNQLRAATIGSLNFVGGLIAIPYTVGLFNTDYAPEYKNATTATLVMACVLFCYYFLILAFDRYQQRKRAYIREIYESEGTTIEGLEAIDSTRKIDEKQKV